MQENDGDSSVPRIMGVVGVCTDDTSPYAHAHFFSLRTPRVITRLAQGLDDSLCVWKSQFIFGHVFVECSFDPVSSYFLITYCLTDTTFCLADATDWNQSTPMCNSARGWTVWSCGRVDPKHRV